MEGKYEVVKFIDDQVAIDVNITPEIETVWLSQDEMALLFDVDRTRITRHIKNIYIEKELDEISVCAENAHTASDGKVYQVKYYNLDMIIFVEYRVKTHSSPTTESESENYSF